MTALEHGWKPFEIPPDRAAKRIAYGLDRDKPIVAFPAIFALITRIGGLLPEALRPFTSRPFRFKVTPNKTDDVTA